MQIYREICREKLSGYPSFMDFDDKNFIQLGSFNS